MALSLDPATRLISVPQADLTFVSGTLYELDTNQFRKDVMALLASESYMWMPDAFQHNSEVVVAGTTFARTLEFINNYSVQFENTGAAYTVRLIGSNNNIFDVENGILTPTPLVTVISGNSAGLVNGDISGQLVEGTLTMQQAMKVVLAATAGKLSGAGTGTVTIRDTNDTLDRIVATTDASGNRITVTLDLS